MKAKSYVNLTTDLDRVDRVKPLRWAPQGSWHVWLAQSLESFNSKWFSIKFILLLSCPLLFRFVGTQYCEVTMGNRRAPVQCRWFIKKRLLWRAVCHSIWYQALNMRTTTMSVVSF